MGVPGNANALLLRSAAAAGGYQVSRSLRFNSSDSAYLSRTPASAGNRKTWTWAGWVKRSGTGAVLDHIFLGSLVTDAEGIRFNSSDKIQFYLNGGSFAANLITTQVFRDFSAWYHIVVAVDTTQATASNRVKLYINGSQITAFDTSTYPSQNYDCLAINTTAVHWIGANIAGPFYSNFYLADCYLIDGSALTPSSFTETDATTGQLIPKAYTGSYGTNGFHLEFADNSSNTATTLGKDTSGNGNNWTPNNLSVTAGAGNDSLVDVPTNGAQTDTGAGGEVRGNYCTLNPLNTGDTHTLSNGNLDTTLSGSTSSKTSIGTIGVSSGKWYYEATVGSGGSGYYPGFGFDTNPLPGSQSGSNATGYLYMRTGEKFNNSTLSSYGSSFTSGDVIGVALNLDAGTIIFYKNGVSQGQAFSSISGTALPVVIGFSSGGASMNFGQRPFAYTAPSGFKALVDTNLPTPVVAKPSTVMDVLLWSGNSTNGRNITGLGFNPDFVWIKRRSSSYSNLLFDSVRGFGSTGWTRQLISDSTAAEDSGTTNTISSFNNDGFTLGTDGGVNVSGQTYVGWTWDAGSSTVTNTAGSITSSVRANATSGFSIVTFTSNASGNATVGHGLGVAPSLVILKNRTGGAGNWLVFHKAVCTKDNFLYLNSTNALGTYTDVQGAAIPSSTVFGINAGIGIAGSADCVAYCFAPVVGYSSFGSYVGNGTSGDGVFVYTGFRVRWLLIKQSSAAGEQWFLLDSARSPYNIAQEYLCPSASFGETSAYNIVDFLSNGFKLRATGSISSFNGSGATYIYAAFAESPLNYSRAR